MKKTVLFDLDGTLIPMSQDDFSRKYFSLLTKKMATKGMEPELLMKAVWAGIGAMVQNDGKQKNETAFWNCFCKFWEKDAKEMIPDFEAFYANEFDETKYIMQTTETPRKIVDFLKSQGCQLVLATNPLFPPIAVHTRLSWIGLKPEDFIRITTYDNSSFCKPNLKYYKEILSIIGKAPEECLMVGNNVVEDMCVNQLGMDTFLITDFMEEGKGKDISIYNHGSMDEFYRWIQEGFAQ